MGSVDPLAVPVPPELGGPIYSWIRRLALQADLQGADKVLREAFIDLTSSLSVAIVYPGADGLWTLGEDGEIPKEATPIVAVAQARRAMIATHAALIPIVTSSETVGVVILTRNPRNPAFHPIEQIAMVALARESAAILHHLAVAHLQRASEIKADQGGLYRGEALEAHRSRGNEGVPVNLSPSWIKRAYPLLVVTILIALTASIFITVPTYSSGAGVVTLQATPITAPTAGTVEQVLVAPGQQVQEGTVLVRLHSAEQDAELKSAQSDADNATIQYLFDASDEMVRKTLATALVRVDREKARVESRLVRARKAGTVSDIRVRVGALLQPGDPILQIVDPSADPEVWAFLPGKDRPRLREGQDLQIEIIGYTKTREHAKISYVSPEILGPTEAAKIVGATLADSIKLPPGSYVWVKAKLPKKTFKTQHQTLWFHHGMPVKAEVKIQNKPFLVTLLPALEKYLPE
jgi:biotin carboxyl carrier protein